MSRAIQVDALWNGLTDNSGNLLNAGTVTFYSVGTTTLKNVYTAPDMLSVLTNPVTLDGYGRALVFASGAYKVLVKDSAGNTIFTRDNLIYEVANDAIMNGGTTSGSSNAYSASPSPAISAYAAGQEITLIANHTNTGAATLAVSGLAATAIKAGDGSTALVAGDMIAGRAYKLIYDSSSGGRWQLLNPSRTVYQKIRAAGTEDLYLMGGTNLRLGTNDVDRFLVNNSGHMYPNADGTYDIGILTTNRLRDIHFNGGLKAPNQAGNTVISASGSMTVGSTSILHSNYCRIGQFCLFDFAFETTLAGTASTIVKASHPIAGVAMNGGAAFPANVENVTDNTVYSDAFWQYDGTDIVFFRHPTANFTVGSKVHRFFAQGIYRAV